MTNIIRFPIERRDYTVLPGTGPAKLINLAKWRVVHEWIARMKRRQGHA